MSENIRFAYQSIKSHKMRSFLTMLGVIIGIASIIAIVSTIKGTNELIMEKMIGAGNNNVTISLRQGDEPYYMDMGSPKGVHPVTDGQKEEIRALRYVQDATFYQYRDYTSDIRAGKGSLDSARILGIDAHFLETRGYEVYEGRPFKGTDYKRIRKAALLDEAAAEILFPSGGAVGATVDIAGEPFTVSGLIRRTGDAEPVIETYSDYLEYYEEEYGMVLIPQSAWPIIYSFDEPENCAVRVDAVEHMSRVGRDAAKIMNRSVSGKEITYKAEDLVEKARSQQELAASTNNLLLWVAGIALLVGGIGVMNIMLVSVTERTSEIGLKKALGARKKKILFQFLTESAMLTSLGGVLGVIAGIALSRIISVATKTPAALSVPAILSGVLFSMVIGIIFGLLPSIKAANMNPIDALRRE